MSRTLDAKLEPPRVLVLATGTIYRNPAPHLRSLHAYYPSIVELGGGGMLASFVIGSAMESVDSQVYLARSDDWGQTWSPPAPLHRKADDQTETCRIARMRDGEIVLLLSESERLDPDVGATNPATLGHVPTRLSLYRSGDGGKSWRQSQSLIPPLVGPTFELCSPIVELSDGRWLLPTSTWRGWEGDAPNGTKAVAFFSEDRGQSWPQAVDVMNRTEHGILFWEQKIVEINNDRLLAVTWAYNEKTRTDLPNHFALADRQSLRFGAPASTPLTGQTPELLHLGDGLILCVYRRVDDPGLWACVAHIDEDGGWRVVSEQCLWRPAVPAPATDGSLVEQFRGLKFGAPCLKRLSNGDVYLAFWCMEDCVSNIRWIRLDCGSSTGGVP